MVKKTFLDHICDELCYKKNKLALSRRVQPLVHHFMPGCFRKMTLSLFNTSRVQDYKNVMFLFCLINNQKQNNFHFVYL